MVGREPKKGATSLAQSARGKDFLTEWKEISNERDEQRTDYIF
jgi:hypothetical protein